MKRTIVIIGEEQKSLAKKIIDSLDYDEIHEVHFKPHKKNRSEAQKGLYFLWVGIIANEIGDTKDGQHEEFKKTLLIPIYERNQNHPHHEAMPVLRELWKTDRKAAEIMWKSIVKMTSTNDAEVDEFTEYLNDVEKLAMSLGIGLPHPEDMYREAMNV